MFNVDSYGGWILRCLGVWQGGDYLDKMEKDFGIELHLSDRETVDNICNCLENFRKRPRVGDMFARQIFDAVIERAVDELGAKESDFEYDIDGLFDTYLKYKDNIVETWEEIVNIHNKRNRRKQK